MAAKKPKRRTQETPSAQDLLVLELQEIHSAESQLSRALPRINRDVESNQLRKMLEQRLREGEQVISDVESALEELDESPGRKKNIAAEGLINDAREHVQEIQGGPALDAVLIAAVQKTEHYCIAAWGTARSLAEATDQDSAVKAMERALQEGKKFDEQLTRLAEDEITPALLQLSGEDESEEGEEQSRDGHSRSGRGGKERRTSP